MKFFVAYINPSVAGYVIQILAGAAFGAIFVVKYYWRRLTGKSPRPKDKPKAE